MRRDAPHGPAAMNMHQDRPHRGSSSRQGPSAAAADRRGEAGGGLLAVLRNKALREAVESVVIAFALAFLFRTFEAEAFVIPTGSMAPTLLGRHRVITCPECHYKYSVSASGEVNQDTEEQVGEVVAGTCPQCGYTSCVNPRLGTDDRTKHPPAGVQHGPGRRVSGHVVAGGRPDSGVEIRLPDARPRAVERGRLSFPGDATKNYIKRLVGLPGETMRIYRGDMYTGPYDAAAYDQNVPLRYRIQRKPPVKVLAMMQPVDDNDFVIDKSPPRAGRPVGQPGPAAARRRRAAGKAATARAASATDGTGSGVAWIRYQHLVPSFDEWQELLQPGPLSAADRQNVKPELITDTTRTIRA